MVRIGEIVHRYQIGESRDRYRDRRSPGPAGAQLSQPVSWHGRIWHVRVHQMNVTVLVVSGAERIVP